MQNFETQAKSIGLIFDLSVRHAKNGKRILDIIKKKMIDIVRSLLVNGEDSMYLYHQDLIESCTKHGEQVFAIGNHNADGYAINLNFALKQTLYVLMAEDATFEKFVILITDRVDNSQALKKAIFLNKKEMINCHFFFIGIGNFYDKSVLKEIANASEDVTYIHLDDPNDLDEKIFKEKIDGKNTHSQTDERCERVQLSSGHNCSISRAIRPIDAIDAESVPVDEEQLLPTDLS